jgi:hypothetical protein
VKRLRWETAERRRQPEHPIRDSALVYLFMAAVIVGLSVATGGSVGRALVVAALFYAAAMAWVVMRWRQRLRGGGRK